MKKNLTKQNTRELYFYKDGVKKIVDYKDKSTYPSELYGDINSGLSGNISELYGDINSELRGNISGLRGDISGLRGNCDNIKGDLDDCDITYEDREKGIDIQNLIIN